MKVLEIVSNLDYGEDFDVQIENIERKCLLSKMVGEDRFTKISRHLAMLPIKDLNYDEKRCGLIYVTEYGNVSSMIKLSLLSSNQDFISARLFPNATIGSASVISSLQIKSKGLNVTVGAGFLGYFYGIELADFYFNSDQLDICIILTGDYYDNKLVCDDVLRRNNYINRDCITVTVLLKDEYAEKNNIDSILLKHNCLSKTDNRIHTKVFEKYYCNDAEILDICESSYIAMKCKKMLETNNRVQKLNFGEVEGIDVVLEMIHNG